MWEPNVSRQFVSPVADDPDFLALRDWRVGIVAAEVAVHAGESLMRPFDGFHTPGCDAEYHSVTGMRKRDCAAQVCPLTCQNLGLYELQHFMMAASPRRLPADFPMTSTGLPED